MKREFLRIAAFVLHWFVRFPIIGAIATAFVAVIAFGCGRSFGLPDLFWHQVLILKLIQIAKRLIAHPMVDRAYARASRASPEKRWLHVYASVVIVGFFLVYTILALAMPRWLPSAVAICLIFCIVLLIYGFVRFQFPHERIVVTAALIVAMAVAAILTPYKHRFQIGRASCRERGWIAVVEGPW